MPVQGRSRAAYIKVTTGSAEDWPALGRGGLRSSRRARRSSQRASWSAPRPRRRCGFRAAEEALAGADADDDSFARAGEAAAEEVECISDVRGSAPYKRELVRVFVRRALRQALEGNGAAH